MTQRDTTRISVMEALLDYPDRVRWNTKFSRVDQPSFRQHPLVSAAQIAGFPQGPVIELARGTSGSALALAETEGDVTVLDVSDLALGQLVDAATRRGVAARMRFMHANLEEWAPAEAMYAFVLCTYYWSAKVFAAAAARALLPGGLLAWEAPAFSEHLVSHVRPAWCLKDGEPASLLPPGFEILQQTEIDRGSEVARRMLARRLYQPRQP